MNQINGETSDGFHTFDELYEARMLYHATAVKHWMSEGYKVYKSTRHSDGEECFGGGWFIVVTELPAGQVSQHYPMKDWNLFEVPVMSRAHHYDGHTNDEVLARLGDQLARERYL